LVFPTGGRAIAVARTGARAAVPVGTSQIGVASVDEGQIVAVTSPDGVSVHALDGSRHATLLGASQDPQPGSAPPTLSPDGRLLAKGDASGQVTVTEILDNRAASPRVLDRVEDPLLALSFDPTGRFLAFAHGSVIDVRSVPSGDSVTRIALPDEYVVRGLAIHPEGGYVAAYDPLGEALLWRTDDAGPEVQLTDSAATAIEFSPRGNWLSVLTAADTRLWRMSEFRGQPELLAAGASSGPVRFSSDERYVAVATETDFSYEITVWNVPEQRYVASIGSPASDFRFTSDSTALIVARTGIQVVPFQPEAALETTCRLTRGNPLTTEQWDQYAPGFDYVSACP
jgi:WD40 repeat protein